MAVLQNRAGIEMWTEWYTQTFHDGYIRYKTECADWTVAVISLAG